MKRRRKRNRGNRSSTENNSPLFVPSTAAATNSGAKKTFSISCDLFGTEAAANVPEDEEEEDEAAADSWCPNVRRTPCVKKGVVRSCCAAT